MKSLSRYSTKVTSKGYELIHSGIKGQRKGVRRYQNQDGSYTEAGKLHKDAQWSGVKGGKSNKYHNSYYFAHQYKVKNIEVLKRMKIQNVSPKAKARSKREVELMLKYIGRPRQTKK